MILKYRIISQSARFIKSEIFLSEIKSIRYSPKNDIEDIRWIEILWINISIDSLSNSWFPKLDLQNRNWR